jgi:soluble lytic murein transglycosylase-like protein
MSNAEVIEIPVNSKEFEEFVAVFDRFRDGLGQLPEQWEHANKEMAQMAQQVTKMERAMSEQSVSHDDTKEKERERRLRDSESMWASMAKSGRELLGFAINIGSEMLKWGAILGGGALFGSAFGIDRLARNIGDTRRESMGFGVSPSTLQAFDTNFGKVIDTQSFLSSMTSMELDVTKRTPWWGVMHGQAMSGDTGADTMSLLQGIRDFTQQYKGNPGLMGTLAHAYKLPVGDTDLMRISRMGGEEWSDTVKAFKHDQSAFGLSDQGAKAWQDLQIQFERMAVFFKDKFAVALEPIVPNLIALSKAAGDVVAAFLKSPLVKESIDNLTTWIGNLAKNADSDTFLKKIRALSVDMGDLSGIIHTIAHPYDSAVSSATNGIERFFDFMAPSEYSVQRSPEAYANYISRVERNWNLPAGMLDRMWDTESSRSLYPSDSRAGAKGPFQFTDATAKRFGIDPHNPAQSVNAAAEYMTDLINEFHGNYDQALAAWNWGPGNVEGIKGKPDWMRDLPNETRQYLRKTDPNADVPTDDTSRYRAPAFSPIATRNMMRDAASRDNSIFAPQGTGVTVTVVNQTGGSYATSLNQLAAF